jgi:Icc-related predicted phosphoesterase
MRLHVVSDVHGRADALARAGDGADALVCLGDLLLFMDYADHSAGIMGTLFGAERVGEFIRLRTAREFDAAREFSRGLWASLDADPRAVLDEAAREQYEALFAAFPDPTYLTFGNVDQPELFRAALRPHTHLVDGAVVELGGLRFGFVGGGLPTPMRTPYEVPEDRYAAKVEALGEVDVLCSHIPPDVPDLLWDTTAQRHERGSAALLALIERTQPKYALFGHVHQPLLSRTVVGRTQCINVGHFRATGRPYVLEV